ncbi:site-specific DNA-methyltransferase [Denitrobaculum tricleocarpae]|uniref:Site-specific DNA-methyltransferase n=1 Tax=Denitrobaculum tricleocarpae TaxID=2591009 RepID=A0A545TSZ6_9PROT|nr:site-specific DNA-methyltransferase [Denitrobaculum tricleocarpae]TQV80345.1 site-specific DNA-methyltransferase [Denitrobaculum tricleocarpae]
MQDGKNLIESIRSQKSDPKSIMSGLASTPSDSFTNEWNRIIQFASEFWERCEQVYSKDGRYLCRRLNDAALEWLKPVIEDVVWIQIVKPNDRYTNANRLIDFRYRFVGNNLLANNGREFQGDQILDRARKMANAYGSGGMQSHFFTMLCEAAATGESRFLYIQYVNALKKTCDMHFAPLPVANESDQVTDFFCPMLIRPAAEH